MMNRCLSLLLPCIAAMTFAQAAPGAWTHQSSEGEDATSVHYYFYSESGGKIDRVRWVWNGGAQNDPTVTDFLIGPDQITIREYTGKRNALPELLRGGNESLVLVEENLVPTGGKSLGDLLKAPVSLPEDRKVDLENLEGILDQEREPIP